MSRACKDANFYIVTVPTPVDQAKRPDLSALVAASHVVGTVLSPGNVVVYESTVFPGATEEVCVPELEKASGLVFNRDFFAGYSPERINPGDKTHRLPDIVKVTSGSTPEAADLVDAVYAKVITAGTHRASSIRVAEAAKVIENIQRDVNIALINELAMLFKAAWASRRARCSRPPAPNGTSSPSARASSAATASASIPTTSPTRPNRSASIRR